ncbi:hypothetical protein [Kineococcus gypseus]|uniref:hypothetical protein n=1 Tax=Kineococcus gypseus TaxID=1637102 RepID=UPI003D7CD211
MQLDPEQAGRLLAALTRPALRDAVLLDALPEQAPHETSTRGATEGEELHPGAVISALLDTEAAAGTVDARERAGAGVARLLQARPNIQRAHAISDLAVLLARHVDRHIDPHANGRAAAAAWAVAAFTYWNIGEGVRAEGCALAALRCDPAQRLARLVATSLMALAAPQWTARG